MKKIYKSCLGVTLIFLLCLLLFVVFAVIESEYYKDSEQTTTSKSIVSFVFILLVFFLIKRVWFKKQDESIINRVEEKDSVVKFIESFDFVVTESDKDNRNGIPRESYIEDLEQYDHLKFEIEDDNRVVVLWESVDIGYVQKRFSNKIESFIKQDYNIHCYVKKLYKKQGKTLCIAIIEVSKTIKKRNID